MKGYCYLAQPNIVFIIASNIKYGLPNCIDPHSNLLYIAILSKIGQILIHFLLHVSTTNFPKGFISVETYYKIYSSWEDWGWSVEKGKKSYVVFIDLEKAYNKVLREVWYRCTSDLY